MSNENTTEFQVTAEFDRLRYLVFEGMAGKAPRVNATNNHWEVYDNDTQAWVDTGVAATGAAGEDGEDGHSPYINSNGVWMVWNGATGAYVNTGLHAKGQDGKNGYSPYINLQTNTWMYYDDATEEWHNSGVSAQGTPGTPGTNGTDGYSPVVTVTNITGGHRVNITDKTHPSGQNFDVMDGEDGGVRLETSIYPGASVEVADIVRPGEETALYSADIYAMIQSNQLPYIRDKISGDVYQLAKTENYIASAFGHEYTFVHLDDSATKFLDVTADSYVYRSVQSGGGGDGDGGIFLIAATYDSTTQAYTFNKTPAQIDAAISEGLLPVAQVYSYLYTDQYDRQWYVYTHSSFDGEDSYYNFACVFRAGEVRYMQYVASEQMAVVRTMKTVPSVTASDEGKILKVVNGVWTAVDPNA